MEIILNAHATKSSQRNELENIPKSLIPQGGPPSLEELRKERLKARNFQHYLHTFGHERRFDAFVEIIPLLSDTEYWPLVRSVWVGVEVIEPDKKIWLRLLQSKRPSRKLLMTDQEHAELATMPDEVKIWRGCAHTAGVRGMSWTTEKSRAHFFAGYAGGPRRMFYAGPRETTPIVASATCRKSKVLAYFTERQESEIVLNPTNLKDVKIESASEK